MGKRIYMSPVVSVTIPIITTSSPLPDARQGTPYSVQINAINGQLPYVSWSYTGALDPGLSFTFNSTSAQISGTPTTANANYSISVRVIDSNGKQGFASFTLAVAASNQAAAPSISVPSGTYSTPQVVTLASSTPGAFIYYTLDGSIPTTSSTQYINSVFITTAETLNAIAVALGYQPSAVSSATYTINAVAATPTFSPSAGNYGSSINVTVSDTTPQATLYITLDGTTPTTSSPNYHNPAVLTVSANETIKAIAAAPGYQNSAVGTSSYTITTGSFPTSRNKYLWPFGSATDGSGATLVSGTANSIWNQSIGSSAQWHNPNFVPSVWVSYGYQPQENDFLFLDTTQPGVPLYRETNYLGNFSGQNMCLLSGTVLVNPVYVHPNFNATYNAHSAPLNGITGGADNPAAFIQSDGNTLFNNQAVYVCTSNNPGGGNDQFNASYVTNPNPPYGKSIYADGRLGAHGGSHLSNLGGTLRKWEVNGPIYHALRILVNSKQLYNAPNNSGFVANEQIGYGNTSYAYVWPAQGADGYPYSGTDNYVRMGSLFAIPGSVNLSTVGPALGYSAGFEHPFGLILATAMQNYGAYPCDTGNSATFGKVVWCGEASPALAGSPTGYAVGSFETFEDVFAAIYKHSFRIDQYTTPSIMSARNGSDNSMISKWARDNDRIWSVVQVVINNAPTSIGGGGTPRMPPAPPFSN